MSKSTGDAATYGLSRPLNPGEKIDYFISHSWHDDHQIKWRELGLFVENFVHKNKREPTFWLDKACIDQDNISDGLKVLPVNVMACSGMLVLCGETYASRLWCAWELFTLFSFQDAKVALKKVHLVPLTDLGDPATSPVGSSPAGGAPRALSEAGASPGEGVGVGADAAGATAAGATAAGAGAAPTGNVVVDTLTQFCVSDARCYDPNEGEAQWHRIREVVVLLWGCCTPSKPHLAPCLITPPAPTHRAPRAPLG